MNSGFEHHGTRKLYNTTRSGLTLINILPLATLSSTSDKNEKNTLSQKPIYPSVGFMCDIS